MARRTLPWLSLALAALCAALWLLLPASDDPRADAPARLQAQGDPAPPTGGADAAGAEPSDVPAVPAPAFAPTFAPAGPAPSPAVPAPLAAPVVPLQSSDCSVADRVDELVEDLTALAWSSTGHDTRRLEARRLERFVLDVVGCGQEHETRAALRERLPPADERLHARLLVALVGLSGEDLPALWDGVPLAYRKEVLLALAWDPLHATDSADLPLESAAVDPFVEGEPLLPLPLRRTPAAALHPWLVDQLLRGPYEDVRDAAAVVLGIASRDWPEATDDLVQAVLARPDEARAPLFMLLLDPRPGARLAIERFRSRHGGFRGLSSGDLEGHEHFTLELADVEAAACALPAPAELADSLRSSAEPAVRLQAASLALAQLVDGHVGAAERAQLSDGLCAALRQPLDPDSDWTALLALVRLHLQERYQPKLSIGYGTQTQVDQRRVDERTEIFLLHLAHEHPAQRRLAVMGLFGAEDGEAVRSALTGALQSEANSSVANWIRLALLRL